MTAETLIPSPRPPTKAAHEKYSNSLSPIFKTPVTPLIKFFACGFATIVLLSLNSGAAAADAIATTPEKRVEAIRNALINRAMQTRSNINSVAWVDESGRLHESTRVSSDLTLRGIRVESYLGQDDEPQEKIIIDAANSVISNKQCSTNVSRLTRSAVLDIEYRTSNNAASQPHMAEITRLIETRFTEQSTSGQLWQLTQQPAYSDYEQAVRVGARISTPYRINILLDTAGASTDPGAKPAILKFASEVFAGPSSRTPAVALNLSIQVIASRSNQLVWSTSSPLRYPESEVSIQKRPLPDSVVADVGRIVAGWHSQLESKFKCEPVIFDVIRGDGPTAEINAGNGSGLRTNDKVMVFDPSRLPAHVFEEGASEAVFLAEVESIAKHSARLRFLSAPLPATATRWVALPL